MFRPKPSAVWLFLAVVFLAQVTAQAQTQEPTREERIETARAAIKDACLFGTEYELTTTASASISFKKRGVAGEVVVRSLEAKGNPHYVDEQLRLVADDKTRECMMKYLPRLLDALLPPDQRSDAMPQFPSTVLGFAYYTPRTPEAAVVSYLKSGSWQFGPTGLAYEVSFDTNQLRIHFDEDHKVRAAEIQSKQLQGDWNAFFAPTTLADCAITRRIDEKINFERDMQSASRVVGNDPYISKIFPTQVEAFYSKPQNSVQIQFSTLVIKKYPENLNAKEDNIPATPKERLLIATEEAGPNEYTVFVKIYSTQLFAGNVPPKTNDELLWTTEGPVWQIDPRDAKGGGARKCAFSLRVEPRVRTVDTAP